MFQNGAKQILGVLDGKMTQIWNQKYLLPISIINCNEAQAAQQPNLETHPSFMQKNKKKTKITIELKIIYE